MKPTDTHRLRQLLNTYSGTWMARGRLLFMQETVEGFNAETETRLGETTSDDLAELLVLLRHAYWPLVNEITMLRKKLEDAREERRLLAEQLRKEGLIV